MQVFPKSVGAVLEYWYFERGFLPITVQVWDLNHVFVHKWNNVIFLHNSEVKHDVYGRRQNDKDYFWFSIFFM